MINDIAKLVDEVAAIKKGDIVAENHDIVENQLYSFSLNGLAAWLISQIKEVI